MKKSFITLSLIGILTSSILFAKANKKEEVITEAEKQAVMAENNFNIMPDAGALANSLKKNLGDINWVDFINIKIDPKKKYLTNEDKVLNLGVKGADAYFLAIAADVSNLVAVSSAINLILNKIIVNKKSINTRARKVKLKKLKKLVELKKWNKVLTEITILKENINSDFELLDNAHLALLNDIGGWIEGYRLSVEGFKKNYKAKDTITLLQNNLINYLLKKIKESKKLKSFAKTSNIIETLSSIKILLAKAKNDQLTKVQIEELSKILTNAKHYL